MRRVIIVRHGERVDHLFGRGWLESSFDNKGTLKNHNVSTRSRSTSSLFFPGQYKKTNFNMPDEVMARAGHPQVFAKDCPLTQVGELQGLLVGKGLRDAGILSAGNYEVYVSPALRSIQTAKALMQGLDNDAPLKIEPCLFEWTGWYLEGIPRFATFDELDAAGFNIDTSYVPYIPAGELQLDEEVEDYYNRTHNYIQRLLASSDKDIVLVCHGCSLESGSRQLLGKAPRKTEKDFMSVLPTVPFAAIAVLEQDPNTNSWSFNRNSNVSMKIAPVCNFDAHETLVVD